MLSHLRIATSTPCVNCKPSKRLFTPSVREFQGLGPNTTVTSIVTFHGSDTQPQKGQLNKSIHTQWQLTKYCRLTIITRSHMPLKVLAIFLKLFFWLTYNLFPICPLQYKKVVFHVFSSCSSHLFALLSLFSPLCIVLVFLDIFLRCSHSSLQCYVHGASPSMHALVVLCLQCFIFYACTRGVCSQCFTFDACTRSVCSQCFTFDACTHNVCSQCFIFNTCV